MSKYILALIALFLVTESEGQLYINELVAGNQNGIEDDFFQAEDWIEIHNTGGIVNLAGYYLSDDPDSLDMWQFPNTNAGLTTVLPGGYALFWMDNDENQGEDHAGFKLSTDGEGVYLVDPDGETIIDQIEFGPQQPDISYGRECDACSEWVYFNVPTPEATNQQAPEETQLLYINEVMTSNVSYIDDQAGDFDSWIEIFNPNPFQVNLAGYTIETDLGTAEILADGPVETTVSAESFILLWLDAEPEEGNAHMYLLMEDAGTVSLIGPDDTYVDTYTYPALGENVSWGREIDAGTTSIEFNIPTPRVTNSLFIIQPEELFINELMSDNQTDTLDTAMEYEDWFEIYNPNDFEVNVAGYWLTDNQANPMKWQVPLDRPDSTIIPSEGYLLFFADEQQSEGWNHVNFRLSDQGESITLLSPDGFTIADEIEFGPLANDTSYGRFTDGSPDWVMFTETTPEYSNNGATINIEEEDLLSSTPVIYPNPVAAGMTVNFDKARNWQAYNMQGQRVGEGQNERSFETARFAPGAYIIILDNRHRVKMLVQ